MVPVSHYVLSFAGDFEDGVTFYGAGAAIRRPESSASGNREGGFVSLS